MRTIGTMMMGDNIETIYNYIYNNIYNIYNVLPEKNRGM